MEHGRCPCGGIYDTRSVDVTVRTADDEPIELSNLPQGACPRCGSRVYRAQILDLLETLFHFPVKR